MAAHKTTNDIPVSSSHHINPESGTGTSSTQAFPIPNIKNNPHVYMAVYSSVPVYEMMVRGIGVMRRRSDSYMNATQILKVAGLDKSKRTRILEREIIQGEHEKIQGGYGRYQGTWVPFTRAQELATQLNVAQLLAPLFDYRPEPNSEVNIRSTNTKPSSSASRANSHKTTLARQTSRQSLNEKRERSGDTTPLPHDPPEAGPSKRSRLNTPSRQSNGSANTPSSLIDHSHSAMDPDFIIPHSQSQPTAASQCTTSTFAPIHGATVEYPAGPSHLRKSNSSSRSHLEVALKAERNIHTLMALFSNPPDGDELESETHHENPNSVAEVNEVLEDPELEIDTPIDEHCHTALHWASSLARLGLVRAFLRSGADVNRGNDVGETPLMRSTLVTNNFERESFNQLLELLHPSLWTLDNQDRTVLHHICLTASIKGRGESSRYYLECICEWIVNKHGAQFDSQLFDAVDLNGDTALNIAARVGNKHLVRMLLDVGADMTIGNNLGLKPIDFGVGAGETSASYTDDMISAPLRRNPTASAPARSSRDIITSITSSVNSLSEDFENEIRSKTDRLESVRAQLMVATRQLTTQRRQLESLKHDLDERALLELRLKKLRMAIAEEDGFDWTGRSDLDGRPAQAGKLFEQNGIASTLAGLSASQIQLELEPDPFIPPENNQDSLVYLRRLEKWYVRVLSLLRERIGRMKGSNLEQEAKYLKVIGSFIGNTCTNDLSSSGSSMTGRPANQTTSTTQEVPSRATQNVNPADIHDLESMDGHRRKVSTTDAVNKSHEFGRTRSELLKASMIDNKLLKQLMAAIESDGPELDLNRVAGFMQRVQSGSL
ncbi:uncharacterized protein PGTG_02039 [Puccinia graminis f. sp. tritici CRL 75-36-700-3]|uniref:HTH APSES-type domain-containing protein n=1 Tax=Puccinia graminis f. sp. tritici (strain CRL 75-36-700-3 / race SCCL) TaxID=418459 RepID=E3JX03_PUCGT|nr:uncharacterized protein PGTG_02039 [Puccinia graminis f. sp. tritici CRL 75-36-700-3]EFP76578.2 hypothetical protein PGTG_02039 [Puccinia graminis f. sp. tritici CRL 75-36-700-3]